MMKVMEGFLLINKPVGMSSHGVVARVRRILGVKRVGHAGTLDPFASGLLLVAVSRSATKHLAAALHLEKTYLAECVLGFSSETDDSEGVLTPLGDVQKLSKEEVLKAVHRLNGSYDQIPPAYSAKKWRGKKLYEYARAGEALPEASRRTTHVTIQVLEAHELRRTPDAIHLHLHLHVSSGTYIRSIARDLGTVLHTGGYLTELIRTEIGSFTLSEALSLESLTPETPLLPIEETLLRIEASKNR